MNVAYISAVASLPRYLRVRELFALLSNIHPNFSQAKAQDFLAGTDIRPEAKIKNLSKGMIAQLHLAVVMAIDAKLLVLDEPTLGLDITYRKRFYRRLLEDYMTEERTLLITTHQVDEIEFMLSDIMFIRDGELIVHMQMETVNEKYLQLVVSTPPIWNRRGRWVHLQTRRPDCDDFRRRAGDAGRFGPALDAHPLDLSWR